VRCRYLRVLEAVKQIDSYAQFMGLYMAITDVVNGREWDSRNVID